VSPSVVQKLSWSWRFGSSPAALATACGARGVGAGRTTVASSRGSIRTFARTPFTASAMTLP